jgi:integrase
VSDVTTEHMLAILNPIWTRIPLSADNLRLRIERVLDCAKARGWRDGENPARWRGHLRLLLPPKGKLHTIEHHAALDWSEAPAFLAALRTRDGMPARALEFLILTAARSGEAREATWDEIDLRAATWTLLPNRMRTGRAHRVPLSDAAVAVLDRG